MVSPDLVVGWPDTGLVGYTVLNELIVALEAKLLVQVEPLGFHPMDGVQVSNDVVDFPQDEMYYWKGGESDLLLFTGREPTYKVHQFMSLLLSLAEKFHVRRIYTVGGLYARVAHTRTPRVMAVFNMPGLRSQVTRHKVQLASDYEGPPSINSFLQSIALERKLEAISLWGEVPFYLAEVENPKVCGVLLDCLTGMLEVKLDTSELRRRAELVDKNLDEVRRKSPDIEISLHKLENQIQMTDEEAQAFVLRLNEFI